MVSDHRRVARFAPSRVDDLRPELRDAIGASVTVQPAWMMRDGDPFPGEFAWLEVDGDTLHGYWVPARDLVFADDVGH